MRQEFSRKTKAKIIARADGRCERCKAVLKTGEGEVDHLLACALGGDNSPANGRLLCRVCHKEKTAGDVRRTRKADRARDKQSGAMVSKQKIKSRGFNTSPKKARIKKEPLPPKPLFERVEHG